MKITKQQLKQIIKEELQAELSEARRQPGTFEQHMIVGEGEPKSNAAYQELHDKIGKAAALLEQALPEFERIGPSTQRSQMGSESEPYALIPGQLEALRKIVTLFDAGELV